MRRKQRYTKEYTLEDFDCKYCMYYEVRGNKGVCLVDECVCKDDFYEVMARVREADRVQERERQKETSKEVSAGVGQLGNTESAELAGHVE